MMCDAWFNYLAPAVATDVCQDDLAGRNLYGNLAGRNLYRKEVLYQCQD